MDNQAQEPRLGLDDPTSDLNGGQKPTDDQGHKIGDRGSVQKPGAGLRGAPPVQQDITRFLPAVHQPAVYQSAGNLSASDLPTVDQLLARAEKHDAVQQFQEVIGLCEKVLERPSVPGIQRAQALKVVSRAYFFLGQYDRARACTREEVELRGQLSDREGYAKSLNNLGLIALHVGDYQGALEQLLACFNYVMHSGLPMYALTSACLVNIGGLYQELRDLPKAAQYFALGIEASVNAGDVATEIAGLSGLGMVMRDDHHPEQALRQFSRALTLAQEHLQPQDEAEILDNLGQLYSELGNHALARQKFAGALALARRLGAGPSEVNALINLGKLELQQDQPAAAADFLKAGLDRAKTMDSHEPVLIISELLADAYARLQRTDLQVHCLQETLRLERLVKFEEHQQKVHDLSHQLEIERTKHQAEAYRLLNDAAQQAKRQAEEEVQQRTHELELARREVVTRLGVAAEYRDDKTGSHTQRVSHLTALLAQQVGFPGDQVELIRLAARLHDIGKIGVPDTILLKAGKLTESEFEIMKHHTTIGARVLQGGRTKLLQMAEQIAQHHHERWDGSGYPAGLAGENIPIVARIVALADVWDALTTERPYKTAWSFERALGEIELQRGRHFDPALTEGFIQMLRSGSVHLEGIQPAVNSATEARTLLNRAEASNTFPEHLGEHLQQLNQRAWTERQREPDQSVAWATEASALAEQYQDSRGMAESLRTLAFHDLRAANYRLALDHLNLASLQLEGLSDLQLTRDHKNLLAWLYKDLYNSDKAIKNLIESLEISQSLQDMHGQANAFANLGIISATRMDDREGAQSYFKQAYELHFQLENLSGQANCLYNIADNEVELEKYSLARDSGARAVEAARAAGNPVLEAVSLAVVGRAWAGLEDFVAAAEYLDQASAIFVDNEIEAPDASGWVNLYRGRNLMDLRLYEEAGEVLKMVLDEASRFDLKELTVRANHELAVFYKSQGKFDVAMEYLEAERVIEGALTRQQTAERTHGLKMQYETERVQTEAETYRIRTLELAEMNVALETVNREKSFLLTTLQEQTSILERQVREDALTGLYNRRHIEDLLREQFQKCMVEGTPLSVAMIDVDHFKRINDSFSHSVGDEVLRQMGHLLTSNKRNTDLVGRYGGEEFLLVMPNTSIEIAAIIIDRLRKNVQNAPWHNIVHTLQVTLSIGAADNLEQTNYEKMVAAADGKLYEAKRYRNAIEF